MNKDYQIRALKGVITKYKKRILFLENILNKDSSDENNEYVVRYKAKLRGVVDGTWNYFKKFEEKIHVSDHLEKATIVNKNKGEEIINEINRRYDDADDIFEIAEIELYSLSKKKRKLKKKKIVSRFELMDI